MLLSNWLDDRLLLLCGYRRRVPFIKAVSSCTCPACRRKLAATCTALRATGRHWFQAVVVRVKTGDSRLAELARWLQEHQGVYACVSSAECMARVSVRVLVLVRHVWLLCCRINQVLPMCACPTVGSPHVSCA